MEIAHLDAVLAEVIGEVLRHPLGESRDQHALVALHPVVDLREEIVHLRRGGPHGENRVDEPSGAYHLLHHLRLVLALVLRGGRGHEDRAPHELLEFIEAQRAVVQG